MLKFVEKLAESFLSVALPCELLMRLKVCCELGRGRFKAVDWMLASAFGSGMVPGAGGITFRNVAPEKQYFIILKLCTKK